MLERSEHTPEIDRPGIAIAAQGPIEARSGEPIWIDAAALFPAPADSDPREWCRSLFVLCVAQEDHAPLLANLLKDRLVAPDSVERVEIDDGQALRIPLHFDLVQELGAPLPAASYHVQISARQYRSRLVPLVVA